MQTLRRIPYYGTLALLMYMPFHIFLAQSLSLLTGGLDVWKVAKDFITIFILFITIFLAFQNKKVRDDKVFRTIFLLAVIYALLHIFTYMVFKQTNLSIALLASAYNNRLLWLFIIAFSGVRLVSDKHINTRIIKITLAVSTVVCLIGLLQWFLPKDILTHFGYSLERGVKPNFFINEDINYPRVMSTIRDPNSLGAFLILPTMLIVSLYTKVKKEKKKLLTGLLMVHGLILLLSFSRAAWGGIFIAGLTLLFINNKQKSINSFRKYWLVIVALIVLFGIGFYNQRQTYFVRSVVFRIDDKNSATDPDSDELHASFIREGVEGVMEKPFGHGPGTAGIVSIQNQSGSFLTENYYIQIAYEVGLFGVAVFIASWGYVMKKLYEKKDLLSRTIFATGVAYFVMAFVMHLWTNEVVATQWWLLSGVALGFVTSTKKAKKL